MVAHFVVYRTAEYKAKTEKFHSLINRQRQLLKLTDMEELFGRDSTPAKTEFQFNISQTVFLKREVFRVSAPESFERACGRPERDREKRARPVMCNLYRLTELARS